VANELRRRSRRPWPTAAGAVSAFAGRTRPIPGRPRARSHHDSDGLPFRRPASSRNMAI